MESNETTTLVERHRSKKSENGQVEDNSAEEISADRAQSLRKKWKAHRDKITAGVSNRLSNSPGFHSVTIRTDFLCSI